MLTSTARSCVPPNHAASSPSGVSTIVEAWLEGNGGWSTMKRRSRMQGSVGGVVSAAVNPAAAGSAAAANKLDMNFIGAGAEPRDAASIQGRF